MIEVKNIHKSFGTLEVLKGVNLTVKKGEIVSIIGKSGAGKTTLLQIIGTLDKPDSGNIMIDGVDVFALKEKELADFRNRHIGFIFQFHQLLPEFTTLENVMMPAMIACMEEKEAEQRAMKLLTELGMAERITHKPNQLSGGEKQRVAAARAMMMSPNVILAVALMRIIKKNYTNCCCKCASNMDRRLLSSHMIRNWRRLVIE